MAGLDTQLNMRARPSIAVIGGGYAGMAAALTLAEHGMAPSVFEAGHTLGGRARALSLPDHPMALDNGQHLLLGAYHTTLQLIRDVHATPPWLRLPLQLYSEGGLQLRAAPLPAPWHTLLGLLRADGLPLADRLRAAGFMAAQHRRNFRLEQDCSVGQLLTGQGERLIRLLWQPLCLAALNTPVEVASAQTFLNVLRDSLTGRREDSDLILPTCDLGELFPLPAAQRIRALGGHIQTGHRIRKMAYQNGRMLLDGQPFDRVVCAVAPFHAAALLRPIEALHPLADTIDRLRYWPIATVWLQYPADIRLPRPMTGLTGTLAQWVFDRSHTHGQSGLLAVVVSVAPARLDVAALARQVTHELQLAFGLPAHPLWQRTVVERRATWSCEAHVVRPAHRTAIDALYLAGDYTDSPYPATLEAAVQSGVQCAGHILSTA